MQIARQKKITAYKCNLVQQTIAQIKTNARARKRV